MTANGLTLKTIPTTSTPLKEHGLQELKAHDDVISLISESVKSPSFFVAYLDYAVLIGRYAQHQFQSALNEKFDPKYLQRLRVFNADEELLLWRSGQTLKGRFRKDGEGNKMQVVDAEQVLFGTTAKDVSTDGANFTEISEERGTKLILPFKGLFVDNEKQRIFLKTRNYVDYTPAHQATYTDCRFVGFADKNGDLQ